MWLPIILSCLSLVASQAGLEDVPGIDAWKEALQEHRLAEGKVAPKKAEEAPGLPNWEAHQKAVLEAEKKLQESGEVGKGKDKTDKQITTTVKNIEGKAKNNKKNTRKAAVAEGFTDIVKSSIKKLLAKLSGKDTGKKSAGKELKSKVESLLDNTRDEKIRLGDRQYSYLDKLIDKYGKEDRPTQNNRDILKLFKRKYKKKDYRNYRNRQRALRRERYRDRFAFLSDYYPEPLPRRPSYLRILDGDYLDLVSNYDDYDYDVVDDRDYVDDLLDERGAASALIESKLLERQLKRLLRNN